MHGLIPQPLLSDLQNAASLPRSEYYKKAIALMEKMGKSDAFGYKSGVLAADNYHEIPKKMNEKLFIAPEATDGIYPINAIMNTSKEYIALPISSGAYEHENERMGAEGSRLSKELSSKLTQNNTEAFSAEFKQSFAKAAAYFELESEDNLPKMMALLEKSPTALSTDEMKL